MDQFEKNAQELCRRVGRLNLVVNKVLTAYRPVKEFQEEPYVFYHFLLEKFNSTLEAANLIFLYIKNNPRLERFVFSYLKDLMADSITVNYVTFKAGRDVSRLPKNFKKYFFKLEGPNISEMVREVQKDVDLSAYLKFYRTFSRINQPTFEFINKEYNESELMDTLMAYHEAVVLIVINIEVFFQTFYQSDTPEFQEVKNNYIESIKQFEYS